ncbi:hypothetical protein [Undibacterium hunanense]|nr:hypothetical protein [Undibacterium hunanense]
MTWFPSRGGVEIRVGIWVEVGAEPQADKADMSNSENSDKKAK